MPRALGMLVAIGAVISGGADAKPPDAVPLHLTKRATEIAQRVAHQKTREALLTDIAALKKSTARPVPSPRRPPPIAVPGAVIVPGLVAGPQAKKVLAEVAAARAGKPKAKERLLALAEKLQYAVDDRWYRGVENPPVKPGDKGDMSWEVGEEAGCESRDGEPTSDCLIWNVNDRPLLHLAAGLVALKAWEAAVKVGGYIRAPPTAAVVARLLDRAIWSAAAAARWPDALKIARAAGVASELAVIEAMAVRLPRSKALTAATRMMSELLFEDDEGVEHPPQAIALARLMIRLGARDQARKLLTPVEGMVGQYDSGGFMAEEEKMRDFTALAVAWALAGSPRQAASAVMSANIWVWQVQGLGSFGEEESEYDDDEERKRRAAPLPFVHPQEPLTAAYRSAKRLPKRAQAIALAAADLLEWELAQCGVVEPKESKESEDLVHWCPSKASALSHRRKHARRLVSVANRLARIDPVRAAQARLRALELIMDMARPSKVARSLIELARISGRAELAVAPATAAHVRRLAAGEKATALPPLTVACGKDLKLKRSPDRYGRARAFCADADGTKEGRLRIRTKRGVLILERDAEEETTVRCSNGTTI